jgi:hypothetical protein
MNDFRFLNRTNNKSISPEDALKGQKIKKPFKENDPRWDIVK